MTAATIPASDAEVFQQYFPLIRWHVAKAKISDDVNEDYSMILMERFIKHGLLAQYDPEKANFRTFLSGFVTSYLRYFKSQDLKQKERSFYSTDYAVGDDFDVPILDLKGYCAPDQLPDVELSITVSHIRSKIEKQESEKFLLFFDIVMLQIEEHGQVDSAELAELFDVTRASIHNWRKKLRAYFEEI